MSRAPWALALAVRPRASPGLAATFGAEATTDLRRRGLSWSDGKPALEAFASVPLTGGLSLEAGAATLRQSPRHGGADLLIEAALRYTHQIDAWTLSAQVQGLGFAGAEDQNYAQLRGAIARTIGPVQLQASADWAPPQSAIGGSNLYLAGRASTGIPGTPLTIAAGIGRSTGTDDGSGRAARLRPGGSYTDYRLDADYIIGAVSLGASLTATSIDLDAADVGTRLLFRAGVSF
jgi:hypothetical protein